MKIYYREKSGGIEILRCFGIEGRVEIPGMIDDKLTISAAPYAFSSHMDEKEELAMNNEMNEIRYQSILNSGKIYLQRGFIEETKEAFTKVINLGGREVSKDFTIK